MMSYINNIKNINDDIFSTHYMNGLSQQSFNFFNTDEQKNICIQFNLKNVNQSTPFVMEINANVTDDDHLRLSELFGDH